MFCTNCGTDNNNGETNCKNCGAPLGGARSEQTTMLHSIMVLTHITSREPEHMETRISHIRTTMWDSMRA